MRGWSFHKSLSREVQILALFLLVFGLFLIRLTHLQFFHPKNLSQAAFNQSRTIQELHPFRGRILDRSNKEMAVDIQTYSLGVDPSLVSDAKQLSFELSNIIGLDRDYVYERATRKKKFVWVARKLDEDKVNKIKKLNLKCLEFRPEWKRLYPGQTAAGQIIGFTGLDHKGLEGIEFEYDQYLKGISGWKAIVKDAKQREIVSRQLDYVLPVDGYDIKLTLDSVLQHFTDKFLYDACKKYNALGGSAVVMDSKTGDILALSNYPLFNPNNASTEDVQSRRNRSITDIFEPGSVFKLFTFAAALEMRKANFTDEIFCEYGKYYTGGRILHDVHPYGNLSLVDVLVKSSNIGTAKIAMKIGERSLYDFIVKLGFGRKTTIDLPGEISGILRSPSKWSKTSISSIAMGQEIGVTSIQLASAISCVVNGGHLMKPRILQGIYDASGEVVKHFKNEEIGRIISEETSNSMRHMMREVVVKGTGKRAGIEGVNIGGKTGTAQKIEPDGSYSHEHFVSSFGGYIRQNDKIVTILVSIDDPGPQYYGGTVAAPVFKKIAQRVLEFWK